MQITWINHASFLLKKDGVNLICDPWIEGRVFNNSWAQISPTKFKYEDFKDVTHIWFSHEHPDHFFPPNLKNIPLEYRKKITVLYQDTIDRKVTEFCKTQGFKEIIELAPLKEYLISNNFTLISGKVKNETDSWLLIKTDEGNILNLNDCVFESIEEMRSIKKLSKNIDVLLTQFSYASWVGNKADHESKKMHAEEKLTEIQTRIEIFQPIYTIPFASYVWFCKEDNFHMNEHANRIEDVHEFVKRQGSTSVVLYPGDQWKIGTIHESNQSIEKYIMDQHAISINDLEKDQSFEFNDLKTSADQYINRCLIKNNKRKLLSYKPMHVYLTDLDKVFRFSYRNGLSVATDLDREHCDVAFHSQNFKYCMDFDWGYDTIHVAGTLERPSLGKYHNYLEYKWIGTLNNQGLRMEGLLGRIKKKLFS